MAENVQNKEKTSERQEVNKFRWKFFETSPNNTKLVRYNKFTGKIYDVKRNGIHINIFPWVKQKIYNLQEQKFDTPPASSLTSDGNGVKVDYDTDYMYIIIDPAKFGNAEINDNFNLGSDDIKKIICDQLDELVRVYISSHPQNEIVGKGSINILMDSTIQVGLNEIESKYGVKLTKVLIKNPRLPKAIEEQLQKNAELNLKKKQMEYENEIEIQKAQTAKTVTTIKSEGEADRIGKIIDASVIALKDSGVPTSTMVEAIGQKLANEGLVNGSNPNTTVIATNAINYGSSQNSNNNGNYDLNAIMSAAIAAVANNQNKNSGQNANVSGDFNFSTLHFLTLEEQQILINNGRIDAKFANNYCWENLFPEDIECLKSNGFFPPYENENIKTRI